MNQLLEKIDNYLRSQSGSPSANEIQEWRKAGRIRFEKLGIPTTKDEEWKYTNLSGLTHDYFDPITSKPGIDLKESLGSLSHPAEITCVLVNGQIDKTFLKKPVNLQGVEIASLADALKTHPQQIEKLDKCYDSNETGPFIALNQAVIQDGVFVHIRANTTIQPLIHLIHITTTDDKALTASRTMIMLESLSQATILETYLSPNAASEYLSVPLTDIYLADGSTLHYCKAQNESIKAFHIGSTRVWQERNSNLEGFAFMTGGLLTRNNLDVIVNGEGSNTTINGFYGLNHNQHVDNHSSVDHRVPHCTSNQLYKGILNGGSHAVFNGKIFVRQIAQQTNSYQLNKNLLLGRDCRVDTKPQLEIFADDVKCTHGATIGQLNPEEIFYLQARGISRKDAVKLLARGFVEDSLSHIASPAIREKLNAFLEPIFEAFD